MAGQPPGYPEQAPAASSTLCALPVGLDIVQRALGAHEIAEQALFTVSAKLSQIVSIAAMNIF